MYVILKGEMKRLPLEALKKQKGIFVEKKRSFSSCFLDKQERAKKEEQRRGFIRFMWVWGCEKEKFQRRRRSSRAVVKTATYIEKDKFPFVSFCILTKSILCEHEIRV